MMQEYQCDIVTEIRKEQHRTFCQWNGVNSARNEQYKLRLHLPQ